MEALADWGPVVGFLVTLLEIASRHTSRACYSIVTLFEELQIVPSDRVPCTERWNPLLRLRLRRELQSFSFFFHLKSGSPPLKDGRRFGHKPLPATLRVRSSFFLNRYQLSPACRLSALTRDELQAFQWRFCLGEPRRSLRVSRLVFFFEY